MRRKRALASDSSHWRQERVNCCTEGASGALGAAPSAEALQPPPPPALLPPRLHAPPPALDQRRGALQAPHSPLAVTYTSSCAALLLPLLPCSDTQGRALTAAHVPSDSTARDCCTSTLLDCHCSTR